ncbi:MAG: ATP-binding cassette domain-containing protein [Phycisphaerales bacterium]|nr:ATP-binding cassette domain-containing protein [Phycisphaerales bacterium]
MSIIVSGVTRRYGAQVAVNNISFSIQPGQIVGFLGPNGAGKSTTLKMLAGSLMPSSGTIEIRGQDSTKQAQAIKKQIGYLSEGNPLYYDMYVQEYLYFITQCFSLTHKRKRIKDILELTQLTPESNKKIGQLSKGYKQRLGLASVFIHQPEVLILDEPTSGLDPNQLIDMRNLIKAQAYNKTVIFSSHIIQEVTAICDRIIVMHQGTIVANDNLSNLQNEATMGDKKIVIEFEQAIDFSRLSAYIHPDLTTVVTDKKMSITVTEATPHDVRKKIMQFSLDTNQNIQSIQVVQSNLEEIFKNLTQS